MPSWGFKKGEKGEKGEKDADLESKKSSLFSGRSKTPKSGGPSSEQNPYAVPPAGNDPYASRSTNPYAAQNGKQQNDPYMSGPPAGSQANGFNQNPPAYSSASSSSGPLSNRNEKSPVPPGGYGGAQQSRYQAPGNSYVQASGYGSNPYGKGEAQPSPHGAGGYGGLGRSNSQDTMTTDAGRNALFGDAPQRAAAKGPQQPPPEQGADSSYANTGGYNTSGIDDGYGTGPPRQLTAEEEEDQDVEAMKQEGRFLNRQAADTIERAAMRADAMMDLGADTLARLGRQGEMLHNAEHNLDLAAIQNREGAGNVRELKTANRSMFVPHFESKKKKQAQLDYLAAVHKEERDQAERTREAAYKTQARAQANDRTFNNSGRGGGGDDLAKRAERERNKAKYMFEDADENDEEVERRIDDGLDRTLHGVGRLNLLARALGDEIESQNKRLPGLNKKVDDVDDGIHANTNKLRQIR